ncbi:MAG: GIY-YIG nuclease family protein [bacterium]
MDSRKAQQKNLIQNYKKQPKKLGAYCIRNTANSKCFVGVSRDLDARINRHRFELRCNSEHVSAELQEDWNNQGSDVFEFTILDTIEPSDDPRYDPSEDLMVLEQLWLEQLRPFMPHGYIQPPVS